MNGARPVLTVARGLPGSGKTTEAEAWVRGGKGRARVNRDDLRAMLHGGQEWSPALERITVVARNALIRSLLLHEVSVFCDDTNLDGAAVDRLEALAWLAGAAFRVRDLRHVPVQVCIDRDAARKAGGCRGVGEQVIRDMAAKHSLPAGNPHE